MKEVGIEHRGLSVARDSPGACLPRLLCVLLLCTSLMGTLALRAEAQPPKHILILSSFSDRGDYSSINDIKSALQTALPWVIDFDVEFLGGRRLDEKGYEAILTEALKHSYAEKKLDLVLVVSYTGLQFAARHHDELFPGVPIIFLDVDPDQIAGQKMWPGVTGVTAQAGIRETVDLALHLHPNAQAVAVIINSSTPDKYFLGRIHAELLRHLEVTEIDLVGLPTKDLLERVAGLPPQTIVLFELAAQESVQPAIGVNEVLTRIAKRLPTYSIFPFDVLNHGGVGGVGYPWSPELSMVAQEARRTLSGEPPDTIPVMNYSNLHAEVDWRQLQYWHIPESALPLGSLILYREPTLWQRDRKYIWAAMMLIVAQSILIAALLLQRAKKRKTESVLRESELRFRVMADSTPALIWMCDERGKITYLNDKRVAFTGANQDVEYEKTWKSLVHPDDLQRVTEANSRALSTRGSFSKEYRLLRSDGIYRWMFDVSSPRMNGDGSFAGFIGSAIDITDQRLAQEALKKVSGRLIEAQEKERTRIARDLHDDICQRLALLSMELEQANRNGSPPATKQRLEEIRQRCAEIAGDVQSLSHELHSSRLDHLGIVAAVRGFCKEFAKQHKTDIEFTDQNVPADLPKEVSLCLFRITQEALHNAFKYSGTRQYSVALTGNAEAVRLRVTDQGVGFDLDRARRESGLGLVSMQERANLVGGEFQVESQQGGGTTVIVTVPLPSTMPKYPAEQPVDSASIATENS